MFSYGFLSSMSGLTASLDEADCERERELSRGGGNGSLVRSFYELYAHIELFVWDFDHLRALTLEKYVSRWIHNPK